MHSSRHLLIAAVVAVGSFAFASTSGAQQTAKHTMTKTTTTVHVKGDPKLKAEAKVSEADAIATAEKEVPNGKIESAEIEREGGKLVYSFDLKAPHKSGVEEVQVDVVPVDPAGQCDGAFAEPVPAFRVERQALRTVPGDLVPGVPAGTNPVGVRDLDSEVQRRQADSHRGITR